MFVSVFGEFELKDVCVHFPPSKTKILLELLLRQGLRLLQKFFMNKNHVFGTQLLSVSEKNMTIFFRNKNNYGTTISLSYFYKSFLSLEPPLI